jgi:hypothetical protein
MRDTMRQNEANPDGSIDEVYLSYYESLLTLVI